MIKSEFITYKNSKGMNIAGVCDYHPLTGKDDNLIVIPPAFGETKTDSVSLSYFLAANGFKVVRYDATNHQGESDGEIFNFTLDGAKADLEDTIDFITREFRTDGVGIVAKSLGWRYSLRAACDKRVRFLLGIGGIVNLRGTIKSVYQEDLIEKAMKGGLKSWKIDDIFGFRIKTDFLETAINDNYHSLEGTKKELGRLDIPVSYIFAENDVWIDLKDVKKVINGKGRYIEMHVVPDALHQIGENPLAALHVFRQSVISCRKFFYGDPAGPCVVRKPDIRTVAVQTRLEKKRLRPCELTKEKEKSFWKTYLKKYSIINQSKEYRDYLDAVVEMSGGTGPDEIILDCGCGPGFLGSWITGKNRGQFSRYVSMDIIKSVLTRARTRHFKVASGISENGRPDSRLSEKFSYVCGDLDNSRKYRSSHHICFKDNMFDKIFSSLLISYLERPLLFLKESRRILKPGGKIVVSSLKPHADLSLIYRKFVSETGSIDDIAKARRLLDSAGMIKIKESQGYYCFYSQEELTGLLAKAGFTNIRCYRSFGNQTNVAMGTK